jgi:Large extracellular alpha-helical protein
MKSRKTLSFLLLYAVFINFLAPFVSAQNEIQKADAENQTEPKGLQFSLRETSGEVQRRKPKPKGNFDVLTEAEANAIFRRLPPLKSENAETADFKTPAESLPPPKTGNVIQTKFPAAESRQTPETNGENPVALKVERFTPEGKRSVVSDLSVTFSQPMTAVTSQASENVPVVLSPQPSGRWRWLGTKTLVFEADTRFPMATAYMVKIPAGTRSAVGGILEKDFSWTFSTPPPKVEKFFAGDGKVRRDALLLAVFNQEIDAEAVLRKTKAEAGGRKIPLRLATSDEIAADEKISKAVKDLPPKRFAVFRTAELFPSDSTVSVSFESGLPSAEGSLTATETQRFSFKTFGELKFEKSFCDYDKNKKECEFYDDWFLYFNNPIDAESFDAAQVVIEPPLEDAEISVDGNRIEISGCCKKSRTTYKVTVKGALKDEFGQTLGKDVSTQFKITAREPSLHTDAYKKNFVVLDPHAKRTFSVYSVNYSSLKIKLYAVSPEDFRAFRDFLRNDENQLPSFGKLVYDKNVEVKSSPDEFAETRIDLAPAFPGGFGHAVLSVEPTSKGKRNERIVVWFQATDIGIDAFADYESLTVFASELKTGKPLSGVSLNIAGEVFGTTGENGVAKLELPAKIEHKNTVLIARRGEDSAILPESFYNRSESEWTRKTPKESLRWFVFDDRKMYRPGETVSIKGYVRRVSGGKFSDVGEVGDAVRELNYVLKDSRNNEVLRGKANLNAFGAFDFQINLPKTINLGYQYLEIEAVSTAEKEKITHYFQVQEFRRPEFEVSTEIETSAPFIVGSSATFAVEAKYYSGGFLTGAETIWRVTAEPANYTPPNRDDYTFGKFIPWWEIYYDYDSNEENIQEFSGFTDAEGRHRVEIDFIAVNPARPYTVKAEARVQDVNRQTFASSKRLLVHPSELYVGLRPEKVFVLKNEPFRIETITTDIDGNLVSGAPVFVKAELKDWRQIKGEWQEVTVDEQACEIRSASEPVACEFTAKYGGTLTVKASVADRLGRRNESEITVWTAGASFEPASGVENESVEMIPNKREYAPGETAEILVNAPFFPAEGVLTLRRGGIIKTERFSMNESSTVLRVLIEEEFLPNVYAQVNLVGTTKRIFFNDERDEKLPARTAFASGELKLEVSTASRRLNVTAEPQTKVLEPGGSTEIKIAVKDFQGNPSANTEVAVIAVDESVLALTGDRIADPLKSFYPHIEAGVRDYHLREYVTLAPPETENSNFIVGFGSGKGVGSGTGDGVGWKAADFQASLEIESSTKENGENFSENDQIRIRRNFSALAVFSPSVVTDEKGEAVVNLTLPDNLTRYRITAVAVTKSKHFGIAESNLTARQPLIVRPSAPRFMNFGDKIELPVVIQNQTDNPLTVDVAVRASNALLTEGNGRKVTIPANDRVEVHFPVAAEKAGAARFQVGVVSEKFADAAEFEIPVYTPATSEAFAVYGTIDRSETVVQPVELPENVFSEFGGLEITTSSTQLQELTDAFIYLQNYPFDCAEQISSRILSVVALREVLQVFEAKDMPLPEAIEAKMSADIERLVKLQHKDGGFSFWRSDDASQPFISAHVAHALARARLKGYKVPPETLEKSLDFLKNIESHYPNSYSRESRLAISAYALYVRDLLGDRDAAKARKILRENATENFSAEALGWILSVLVEDKSSMSEANLIRREILNRVTETAGAAHFVPNYADGEYVLLSSDRRTDGVVLESLLRARSVQSADGTNTEDLIPKIVRGLLANRVNGRWRNTQENAFVLLALDKYFRTYEKLTPNFVARVWFGQDYAGEQNFAGRTTDSNLIQIPMNYLRRQTDAANLILEKQGEGRLYYRIGLKYASKNLKLDAADHGFAVRRTYEAIDSPDDVRQNADGSWTVKAGARVRVKIQMVVPSRRYHVALVDHLPAGFEIINSALAVSESVSELQDRSFYRAILFDHQNLRDERAEAFASLLSDGVWSYTYVVRATTPGEFIAPPAKAEEMYSPETFGRSATDYVTVE